MELEREDFKALAQLGSALWPDQRRAETMTRDALAAVALMDTAPQRSLERLALALLEQFRQNRIDPAALNQPFFRLLPRERFVLAALHLSHWSYARVCRVLGISRDDLEALAWHARLHLARQIAAASGRPLTIPSGARDGASLRMTCPSFDPQHPWTQILLDDEFEPRERLAIQNHLVACRSCQKALAASREIYHSVEALIARTTGDVDSSAERFEQVWRQVRRLKQPGMSFIQSIAIFLSRREVRLVLLLAVALFALKLRG